MSTALTPYRPPPSSSPSSTTLIPRTFSSLLTPQTGHALATELLYRLLFDLLNRLLTSLHRFAAHQLDTFTSYLERRYVEREAARREALEKARESVHQPGIREEVERVAVRRGFLAAKKGEVCPLTKGRDAGVGGGIGGGPPGWVGEVLSGIEEGRLVERDFWGHPFGN